MDWEFERHDWAALGDRGEQVGAGLRELITATDDATCERLVTRVEMIVALQGVVRAGAVEACAVATQGLWAATPQSRPHLMDLLNVLGAGTVGPTAARPEIVTAVRTEFLRGLPVYAELLESGTTGERILALDLISICGDTEPAVRGRAAYLLKRVVD